MNQIPTTKPLYINDVRTTFASLSVTHRHAIAAILTLVDDSTREFQFYLPKDTNEYDDAFVTDYFRAELYNILINLGGQRFDLYLDTADESLVSFVRYALEAFMVERPLADRSGYGIALNVIDRMLRSLRPGSSFAFGLYPLKDRPEARQNRRRDAGGSQSLQTGVGIFKKAATGLEETVICGIDIGGSDIKAVLSVHGKLIALKEYDWFPEKYATVEDIMDPILLLVRQLRASASLQGVRDSQSEDVTRLRSQQDAVFEKDASYEAISAWVEDAESVLSDSTLQIDAIGLCFPDVVVKDKVVGGEVTKTRGMRNNLTREYEAEFTKLTHLDDRLRELCKPGAPVKNTNDGPMAAFTAAVELAAGESPEIVEHGIFAHTLGTELGTGWVASAGGIPEIPLETYNLILDLGSRDAKSFPADDVRSVNNFNTGLEGSIQRYTSQSGVFRLALSLLSGCRDDLIEEFYDKGFLGRSEIDGRPAIEVPTKPKDMRKAFLEHIMDRVESETDDCVKDIFRQVGAALGVAWYETQRILEPQTVERVLFGRLVKRAECFRLMTEGAQALYPEIRFTVADEELANTDLMKQLAAHPHYTVAQFAQAIGAVYYGNTGL